MPEVDDFAEREEDLFNAIFAAGVAGFAEAAEAYRTFMWDELGNRYDLGWENACDSISEGVRELVPA